MNQDKDNEQKLTEFRVFDNSYPLPYQVGKSKTKGEILIMATILFAKEGYAAVTMRDIAEAVDIQAASLYNHFASKEALWEAVLTHAKDLYLIFLQHMKEQMAQATTFAEVLDILFIEPEKMSNELTCYAFALVQAEQFRDAYAREIFLNFLLKYAIDCVQEQFDDCIEKGMVAPFDTRTVASIYSYNVLTSINLSVQKLLGRAVPYEPSDMVARLHRHILGTLTGEFTSSPSEGEGTI